MLYPNITIAPRVSSSDYPAFSVEVRHDNGFDGGDWETFYNGDDKGTGLAVLNQCLQQYPDYPLYIGDREIPIRGYLYKVKTEENVKRFFRDLDKVRNPFYNRKVYENANVGSTVSFTAMNLD